MLELALLLSSISGAATAAAAKRRPKSKLEVPSIGANSHIKEKVNSLRIEKEILTKTISRLYQQEMGLSKIQRDKLLLRYQHQLGVVLAQIEKMEAASKHPDLGPLGDGLITLMDKKLSQLDQRLFELSSKIAVASVQVPEIKKEVTPKEEKKTEKQQVIEEPTVTKPAQIEEPKIETKVAPVEMQAARMRKPMELTTLTEIPSKPFSFPWIEQKPLTQIEIDEFEEPAPQPKPEIVVAPKQESIEIPKKTIDPKEIMEIQSKLDSYQKLAPQLPSPPATLPPEQKPKPVTSDDDSDESDDDDLDKIKSEILKTLSKLEQAEVE